MVVFFLLVHVIHINVDVSVCLCVCGSVPSLAILGVWGCPKDGPFFLLIIDDELSQVLRVQWYVLSYVFFCLLLSILNIWTSDWLHINTSVPKCYMCTANMCKHPKTKTIWCPILWSCICLEFAGPPSHTSHIQDIWLVTIWWFIF